MAARVYLLAWLGWLLEGSWARLRGPLAVKYDLNGSGWCWVSIEVSIVSLSGQNGSRLVCLCGLLLAIGLSIGLDRFRMNL